MKIRVNYIEIDVEKIKPNPWNPNKQSEFMFEKERASIRDHGMLVPVTVRGKGPGYEIIDGEHKFRAAVAEGFTKVPCNNLGKVSDVDAKKLTMILNDIKGSNDQDKLTALLKSLESETTIEDLIRSLPYHENTVRDLLAQATVNWDEISPSMPSSGPNLSIVGADTPPIQEFERPKKEAGKNQPAEPATKFISIEVPTKLHGLFFEQIDLINKLLDSKTPVNEQSPVPAISEIVELLRQNDLKALIGKDSKVLLRKGKKDH